MKERERKLSLKSSTRPSWGNSVSVGGQEKLCSAWSSPAETPSDVILSLTGVL